MNMTIGDAKACKVQLEKRLVELIRQFEEASGMTVTDIHVRRADYFLVSSNERRPICEVTIEASL